MGTDPWSDAVLYLMLERGPRHKAVAELLFQADQRSRIDIMRVSRQLIGYVRGEWLEVVRVVGSAYLAGADLDKFRELVTGRAVRSQGVPRAD